MNTTKNTFLELTGLTTMRVILVGRIAKKATTSNNNNKLKKHVAVKMSISFLKVYN